MSKNLTLQEARFFRSLLLIQFLRSSTLMDILKNLISFSICALDTVWNGLREMAEIWNGENQRKKNKDFFNSQSLCSYLFHCLPAQDLLTGAIKWRSGGDGCQMIIISVLLFQPSQVWNIFRMLQLQLMPFLSNDHNNLQIYMD